MQGLTVIVVIRNEEAHIKACIQSILSQSYDTDLFEIIVVDDFSTDSSVSIVEEFKEEVKLIRLADTLGPEFASLANKKRGITQAVEQAKYDFIQFADC